jgi:hypothetical protein
LARFCSTVQQSTCVVLGQRPNAVTDYARIDGTPEALAAVLAVIGIAVLGQLAVISGRRRRHDFAVLKALGLLRRQVSEITAWQASTLAGSPCWPGCRWGWRRAGGPGSCSAPAWVSRPIPSCRCRWCC